MKHPDKPLGAPMMVRLAKRWEGAPVRAVALLARGDLLRARLEATGARASLGLPFFARWWARRYVGEELSKPVEGATATLPDRALLILDERGALHLVEVVEAGALLGTGEELRAWAPGEATVRTGPGRGKRLLRVEIDVDGEGETYELLAPGRSRRQRAALALIEAVTAGGEGASEWAVLGSNQ